MTFKSNVLLLSAILLLATSSWAASNQDILEKDEGKMPRCLSSNWIEGGEGILFIWNESQSYKREVRAVPLSQAVDQWGGGRADCSDWRDLLAGHLSEGDVGIKSVVVTAQTRSAFGVPIPADVREALAEVQNGATVYHAEKTGDAYLRNHPLANYDLATNKDLTKKFGQGFSGQIYKAWVEAAPENANFKAQVMVRLQGLESGARKALTTAQKLKGYTVLLAPGYMQPVGAGRIKDLLIDLRAVGINFQVLNVNSTAAIEDNIAAMQSQMRPLLFAGKKIILIGLSKGMPELMTAGTRLLKENDTMSHKGQIVGMLSLSGMFDGAFLVDWAHGFPQSLVAGKKVGSVLAQQAQGYGITNFTMDGFNDMRSQSIDGFTAENLKDLPTTVPLICVIGVIPNQGLANDPSIRGLQDSVVQTYLGRHGANDGYVQFPGTCLPRDQRGDNVKELVFDGSHVLLDGSFMGRDLSQTAGRRDTVVSILDVLLTLIH